MPKRRGPRKRSEQSPASQSFDTWFDREIAELNARLDRLESSVPPQCPVTAKPRGPQVRKRRGRRKTKPSGAIAAAAVVPPLSSESIASPAEPASAANEQPTAAPLAPPAPPTGTDLSDPRNFGLMPQTAYLERGTASENEYRQRLARHIAFATKVLHSCTRRACRPPCGESGARSRKPLTRSCASWPQPVRAMPPASPEPQNEKPPLSSRRRPCS